MYDEIKKTLKVKASGGASFEVGSNWASMNGSDPRNFLSVSDAGISMGGSVSMQALPNQITFGGLFTFPSFWAMLVPSTFATPNPMIRPSTAIVENVARTTLLANTLKGMLV